LKSTINEAGKKLSLTKGNIGLLRSLPKAPHGRVGWPWTEETDPDIYKETDTFQKISIVTPTLNQGKYIEQTIRSVLLQNYPDIEYIIIDGGSADETAAIVKKYEPWISYYVSEKDSGQSNAINKGIQKCSGEIFNWLNSDDFYNKGCFRFINENFSDKNFDILAGSYRFFFENEVNERIIDLKLRSTLEETIALVAMNQPSTFFRLNVFRDLGPLNERLHFLMDQDIWKKYLFRCGQERIKIIGKDLVNFRYHPDSKTSTGKFMSEYVSIYHSIAMKAGMKSHADLLLKIYGKEIVESYEFDIDFTEEDIKLAKKAINSMALFNARGAFTSQDPVLLKMWLSVLEKKWLNNEQKKKALALRMKTKLIKYKLTPVLNMINSRNNKSKLRSQKEV
jgi:glycosyltransferase involved in cell wall biosynthesis